MELLRGSACPVVRVLRDEQPHADAAACGILDAPDHPAVRHVRVDDVEGLAGGLQGASDCLGDRPEASRGVVKDAHGHLPGPERGEQRVELLGVHRAAQPAEAREKDELQLRDDGARDADEHVVKAAVLEVVLDACAADPARAPVDDHDLPMVDVPEPVDVPAARAAAPERPGGRPELRRPHDADLDAVRGEPLVERARASLRVGPLRVDHEPYRHALGRLREQDLGELVTDDARPKAELVDVHRGRRRRHVLEDAWVEALPLDQHLGGGRIALLERERERAATELARDDALGVTPEYRRSRPRRRRPISFRWPFHHHPHLLRPELLLLAAADPSSCGRALVAKRS